MSIQSVPAIGTVEMTGTSNIRNSAFRAIHCNIAGTYRITFLDGSVGDFILAAGVYYPYRAMKVTTDADAAVASESIYLML